MSGELQPALAATVVVLRPSPDDDGAPEILLLQRNPKLVFFGGHWVFPGGRVDAADWRGAPNSERPTEVALAAETAAIREAEEESGLRLAPGTLHYVAHWVTPPGPPRRFDTWFFVTEQQCDSEILVDDSEIIDYQWQTAGNALALQEQGDLPLPPPTFFTLHSLKDFANIEEIMAWAAEQEPEPVVG